VVRALQKDGWRIAEEQYLIATDERYVYVDLRIVRQINGTRREMLLVEVKCFPETSAITTELYSAIGQYLVYRAMLLEVGGGIPIYLAIPDTIYQHEFDSAIQRCIRDSQIRLVVINLDKYLSVNRF
jgi:hypothetical protein